MHALAMVPTHSLFNLGIRQKMLLVLLGVLVTALGTATWLNLRQQEENILHASRQHGEDVARIVSQALAYSVVGYDYHTIQLLLEEMARSRDIRYARVTSAKGNVMAESGVKPVAGGRWMQFEQQVVFDRKVVGHLVIATDNQDISERLEGQRATVLTREVLIIFLIAIGEFLALSYLIVRPVSIISRSLDSGVDQYGRIQRDIPVASSDEFGRLAAQFNDMRAQLNEANERLHSKISLADTKLTESNHQLTDQAALLKRMNEELLRLSITDPLTGLYNRRYFERVAASDLALSRRHGDINSLLMVDVDRFKQINDTRGHKGGDAVLVELAQVLGTALRRTDLICRLGGEEFVVLCRRNGQDESMQIAEKIRASVAMHPFMDGDDQLRVTVSVGVTNFPAPDGAETMTVMDYLHRADLALYHSKDSGRNRVTHFSQLMPEPGYIPVDGKEKTI